MTAQAEGCLLRFDDRTEAHASFGRADGWADRCRMLAAGLWPLPLAPDPLDERAWHVRLLRLQPGPAEPELLAAARVLIFESSEAAQHGYTATLYDWPDALPAPLSWPVAEVSRLFVLPEARRGLALQRLWQALRAGFGPPDGPRWWVGSVSAWGCEALLVQQLLHWPAWPAASFRPRFELEAAIEAPTGPPVKLPAHWRLFARAGARRLAAGCDPLLDGAPDVLLAIDWEIEQEKTANR